MPIYEYHCQKCRADFEELILSKSATVSCPHCRSKRVKRLLSRTAIKCGSKFVSSVKGGGCSGCSGGSCHSCK